MPVKKRDRDKALRWAFKKKIATNSLFAHCMGKYRNEGSDFQMRRGKQWLET